MSGKGLGYLAIILVLAVIAAFLYVTLALPNVGPPENIKVDLTPQRIARGEYLANHVALCVDCHSKRDWSKFAGPTEMTGVGGGGEIFNGKFGFPGEVHVPNITPFNLKNWTDGEVFRAITAGETRDGSAIYPLMPWPYYSKMNREDVYAIIAYIRTLKPVAASYPKIRLNFPANIRVHLIPQKAALGELPPASDSVKYGEYLCRSAACIDCHSKENGGKPKAGMEFAGGREYLVNGITVRSANITPDKKTGIGRWKEADFVQMFKSFADPSKASAVSAGGLQTVMPWYDYAGMTEGDLKGIYKYLATIKPVKNSVVKFQQPTKTRSFF
jgi:mono/diheme cytochrome c family protein